MLEKILLRQQEKIKGVDIMDTEYNTLAITSTAFEHEGIIPIQYTGDGSDISPEFQLSEISSGAKSLAVIMDDLDHPVPSYNHWIIWNIQVMKGHILQHGKIVGRYH